MDARWDAYVGAHPQGQVVHLAAWQEVLRRAYRAAPRHLALFDGDTIRGVLPLVWRRGPVSGRRLRSLPGVTAGPLADDARGAERLLRAAREIAERDGASLVVGARGDGVDAAAAGVGLIAAPPTWVLPLPSDPEEMRAGWKRSSNLARSLRKAEGEGLEVRLTEDIGDLRAFYDLYVRTMRKHVSLPRSLRQLRYERELLGPGVARLFVVEHGGEIVAGGYFHDFNGRLVLVYNASREDALPLRPNHLLYWHTIKWAAERGLREYDFGFAWPQGQLGKFKAQWGAEPVEEVVYAWPPVEQNVGRVPGGGSDRVQRLVARVPVPALRMAGSVAYRYL